MIKSNRGECLIDGKGIDILYELNHIFQTILEEQPELLTAVVTAWTPAIEKRTDKLDRKILIGLYEISDELRERVEDGK